MATSSVQSISIISDRIIRLALRRMRKLVAGEEIGADVIADCRESLNAMILEWQTQGARLWKRKQIILFLVPGQRKYLMPGAATACLESDLVSTTLDADAVATDSTIEVASAAGIVDGQTVLLIVSPTEMFTTTVNGAPVGTTVTLTDSLSSDSSAGAAVHFLTPLANKPLRVEYCMHQDAGDNEVMVHHKLREQYLRQTSKDSHGVPVTIYYNSASTTGEMFVWPTGSAYGDRLNLDMMVGFDVFTTAADNADFPQEWMNALSWGLASELGQEFGVSDNRQQMLNGRAAVSLTVMLSFDRNPAPMIIEFDRSDLDHSDSTPMDGFR